MRFDLTYGLERLQVEIDDSRLLTVQRQAIAPPITDVAGAMRAALEQPHDFPPLRRALIPDDRVVIVVDEHLPQLPTLLPPLLEHILQANVKLEAITLLCLPPSTGQAWFKELPAPYQEVQVEVHDPADRSKLSYVATTRKGRRIYLNRTAVDADQLVVLTRRGYDCLLGYSGAEGALYPALSNEETLRETSNMLSLNVPGDTPWPLRQEAGEVAWQLGAPFLVQVIEGAGNELTHILGGVVASSVLGQQLLDARWRVHVAEPADVVLATVSGDPVRHDFSTLAQALACAARVVKTDGRIILLTDSQFDLGVGDLLDRAANAGEALQILEREKRIDRPASFAWGSAAKRAQVFLLSRLPEEAVENLHTTPLQTPAAVQRLLHEPGSCVVLPDAHRMMAVVG